MTRHPRAKKGGSAVDGKAQALAQRNIADPLFDPELPCCLQAPAPATPDLPPADPAPWPAADGGPAPYSYAAYDPAALALPAAEAWGWAAPGQAPPHPLDGSYAYWPHGEMPCIEGYYPTWSPYDCPAAYPGLIVGFPDPAPASGSRPRRRRRYVAGDSAHAAVAEPSQDVARPPKATATSGGPNANGDDDSGAVNDPSPPETPQGLVGAGTFPQEPDLLIERKGRTVRQRVQGLLNRIAPASYRHFEAQLVRLVNGLEGPALEQTLTEVAQCIHQQAISVPLHSELYAALCATIHAAEQRRLHGQRVVAFRRALLNACQEFFDRPPQLPVDFDDLLPHQQLEEEEKLKMQKMGNVQLIADLFKHGLLSESLMELILQKLLWGAAFNAGHRPPEQEVVLACTLLDAVGLRLRPHAGAAFYRRLELLQDSSELRLRFRLQDSLERRAARLAENAAPELARAG